MLYTYPSNKLENLVSALDTLLRNLERSPLSADTILVQHPGMQHWLSMELAQRSEHQICMNAEYPLPVRYFWDLIRLILGPGVVPDRSVYTREILAWRIFRLLDDEELKHQDQMREPTAYWVDQPSGLQARRRFQLAEQLADLYEQYLMFRPEWIEQWEQEPAQHWQAAIWKRLVAADANHPLRLMRQAIANIQKPALPLPDHFFIFGLNALAPIWLDFLTAITEQTSTDIHLLYLNPSAEHWDALQSEKQQIKQLVRENAQPRAAWLQDNEDGFWTSEAGNPLLTSLGQQGQAFVKLLSERAHYDSHVFSPIEPTTTLSWLQADLLNARDGRNEKTDRMMDDSITITSAHSAFREVQGLHDWLLHQFNNDPSLTPKDVLVMCPNVEDYAPFVHAVFARSFAELPDEVPPLPCSVADRNLKDADPSVAAFLELLTLPDARFEVSQILSWLRVPAIAHKFELTPADLQTLTRWLTAANVHWGLSANHKSQWLDVDTSAHFTWQQGLDRLLLGFAYSDQEDFVQGYALMPEVEGSEALLLGKITDIIERLQQLRSDLTRSRTPSEWQDYLIHQLQIALLSSEQSFERSNQSILKAINDVTEFANKAGLDDIEIPLSVIRHVLENAFASPEQTGSQFMTGQITVCSMVPMRSIPFRVVAILGLNDGQFPRTRPPLGFDLMAQDKPRLGDRSRRGDDRYLFLEAMLSARDSLYLSYQGFDIHKNEQRPPSLVLEELFAYLSPAFGFDKKQHIRVMPLQPFSDKNYAGPYPSFEDRWSHLRRQSTQDSSENLAPTDAPQKDWLLNEWIQFFTHPAKVFAQNRLGLYLDRYDDNLPKDSEPFALSHLDRYQIQHTAIAQLLDSGTVENILERQLAASAFPLSTTTESTVLEWQSQAMSFTNVLKTHGASSVTSQPQLIQLDSATLAANLPLTANGEILIWRLANIKGKDLITLWLLHLVANCQQPTTSKGLFRGKEESIDQVTFAPISQARAQLQILHSTLLEGLTTPLFAPSEWLKPLLDDNDDEKTYNTLWADTFRARGLSYDPYIQFFWPEQPDYSRTLATLHQIYDSLLNSATIEPLEETMNG